LTATIIYGDQISKTMRSQMKEEVTQLNRKGIHPRLTVVLIGDHPASKSYVAGKQKASDYVGIESDLINLPDQTTEGELLALIDELNHDSNVNGILVQLPLPEHIDEQQVIEAIDPRKDVDGFHPINIGRMMTNQDAFLSCTPYGILTMLKLKDIKIAGKHVVVIGRSNIVGKPVGQLLLNEDATVTYCHSKTKNLKELVQLADIVIAAVGRAHMINQSYIKKGATVIDVGINRLEDGTLTGDVDFDSVKEKASFLTPVPKGVGPMTITMLLKNTIKAAIDQDSQ